MIYAKYEVIGKDLGRPRNDSKFSKACLRKLEMASTDRKGKKNSKSSKLRKIGIIAKSASQAFQRCKWFVKRNLDEEVMANQSLVNQVKSARGHINIHTADISEM
jgi:hypothetical protein